MCTYLRTQEQWHVLRHGLKEIDTGNNPSIHKFESQIRSDQSLSRVRLFATPWIAARQPSLSLTNSRSSLRLMSIESVMPSSHLCGVIYSMIKLLCYFYRWISIRLKTWQGKYKIGKIIMCTFLQTKHIYGHTLTNSKMRNIEIVS